MNFLRKNAIIFNNLCDVLLQMFHFDKRGKYNWVSRRRNLFFTIYKGVYLGRECASNKAYNGLCNLSNQMVHKKEKKHEKF